MVDGDLGWARGIAKGTRSGARNLKSVTDPCQQFQIDPSPWNCNSNVCFTWNMSGNRLGMCFSCLFDQKAYEWRWRRKITFSIPPNQMAPLQSPNRAVPIEINFLIQKQSIPAQFVAFATNWFLLILVHCISFSDLNLGSNQFKTNKGNTIPKQHPPMHALVLLSVQFYSFPSVYREADRIKTLNKGGYLGEAPYQS